MFSDILNKLNHKIFIVQDRNYWDSLPQYPSKKQDLIFSIDFGLYLDLKKQGFNTFYFDCYLEADYIQSINSKMHYFLNNWFLDENGNDNLVYKNYAIGDAFLLSILTDITYFCHFFFNFLALSKFKYKEILVSTDNELSLIFGKTGIPFTYLYPETKGTKPSYLFPIKKWMTEKVNPTSLSIKFKNTVASCFDYLLNFVDYLFPLKPRIFIQEYFCTFPVIKQLKEDGNFQIITSNYSGIKNIFSERRIKYRSFNFSESAANILLKKIKISKGIEWVENEVNISAFLYDIIYDILERELKDACSFMESTEKYFQGNKPALMVPISDLWLKNRLMIIYCKKNNIPVFCIVNGLLSLSFWKEAKDADWVNSLGEATKLNFFKNEERVLALGDPRMDSYFNSKKRTLNYECPTILIGTSGFNLLDLNSFVAVEFEFMYGVLSSLKKVIDSGKTLNIEIKIRSNGYQYLYKSFVAEYFPGLNIKFYQNENFETLLKQSDLYISFYSQTLIEASALGIPAIYYKNDRQYMLPPFDNKSGLVTALSEDELTEKIIAFFKKSNIFDEFQKPSVIEKYLGPLDGNNTSRNIAFIKKLVRKSA